jgi:hypothetical protein
MYAHWQNMVWYALGIVQAVVIAELSIQATSMMKLFLVAICIPVGVAIGTFEAGVWDALIAKRGK